LSIRASCNKPRLYSSTYPLNVTTVEANLLAKKCNCNESAGRSEVRSSTIRLDNNHEMTWN